MYHYSLLIYPILFLTLLLWGTKRVPSKYVNKPHGAIRPVIMIELN